MRNGFACLDEHEYSDALKIGRKLKRIRHSSAFEILALAHLRSGQLPKAIAILEEGVAKAGRVWVLWELLGNCYSDARRFGKAEKAYQCAFAQEGCDRDVVNLNRAIAFGRRGKFAEAKIALKPVHSARLRRRADACRIRIALQLGELRSAQRLASRLCRQHAAPSETYDPENESEILLTCALALKNGPKTKSKALRLAFEAVEIKPDNGEALAVIREIQHREAVSLDLLQADDPWHLESDDRKAHRTRFLSHGGGCREQRKDGICLCQTLLSKGTSSVAFH
jgi:tetratricopeptide (TPR) repeat protein